MEKFLQFVDVVKKEKFEFENLKEIYVAQCLHESGKGTSKLFLEANNPQGMKYREEIKDYSTPYVYKPDTESADSYAKFPNYESAVRGYWKFIDRSPYTGWRKHAASGEEYIKFIKSCGYATDPNYVSKVLGYVEMAKSLLKNSVFEEIWRTEKTIGGYKVSLVISEEKNYTTQKPPVVTPSEKSKKVALIPGHEPSDEGAYSKTLGLSEWTWNKDLCYKLRDKLVAKGHKVLVVDDSYSCADVANQVNKFEADLSFEFHFNAFDGVAKGNETLYTSKNKFNRELADLVQKKVYNLFKTSNRGVLYTEEGMRGFWNLVTIDCPAVLVEPFFGDNVDDATKGKNLKDKYADVIVEVVEEWEKDI